MVRVALLAFAMVLRGPAKPQSVSDFLLTITASPLPARRALVDSLLRLFPTNPVLEEDTLAHLFYRGQAERVAVAGDMNAWSNASTPLQRIEGTDVWHVLLRLPSDARLDFKLVINDSLWILDPRTPGTVLSGFGPNSELRMPAFVEPQELRVHADTPRGRILDSVFAGQDAGTQRSIRIYLPAGYTGSGGPYPLLLVHDGLEYLSLARMDIVLDNLISWKRIPPLIAVFVPPGRRSDEYAGAGMETFAHYIAHELVPWLDERFAIDPRRQRRAVMGASNGGNISLFQALKCPQTFGLVGAQSTNVVPAVLNGYSTAEQLPERICLDIGTYDIPVLVPLVREFKATLEKRGTQFRFREVNDGHSWGNWRAHLGDMLMYLFGD
jgi:enterochelin esterase family protein